MSSRELLTAIAQRLNAEPDEFEKFIRTLEREFLRNKEQLKEVTDEQWKSMGFPFGLVNEINKSFVQSQEIENPESIPPLLGRRRLRRNTSIVEDDRGLVETQRKRQRLYPVYAGSQQNQQATETIIDTSTTLMRENLSPEEYFFSRAQQIKKIIKDKRALSFIKNDVSQHLPKFVMKENINHKQLKIGDCSIIFPFQPYECQVTYMQRLTEALNEKKNALLESPTGTGKTHSLLCASLAWVKNNPQHKCQIIYTSRTHTQLDQVIEFLKETSYAPKTVLLASRDFLCVNENARKNKKGVKREGQDLSDQCSSLVSGYFQNCQEIDQNKERLPECNNYGYWDSGNIPWEPMQIEELFQLGKNQQLCPYFMMTKRAQNADIVLMPYNYLIDPEIRPRLKVNFENSIILIDEAHNITKKAEEVYSYKITENVVLEAIKTLIKLKKLTIVEEKKQKSNNKLNVKFSSNSNDLQLLINIVEKVKQFKVEAFLNPTFQIQSDEITDCFINKLQVSYSSRDRQFEEFKILQHTEFLNAVTELAAIDLSETKNLKPSQIHSYHAIFQVIKSCLIKQDHAGLYFLIDEEIIRKNLPPRRTLNVMCVDPKIAFESLMEQQPRSVILTSGALSPLEEFAKEIGLQCDKKLENKHIIDSSQVEVLVLTTGEQDCDLNFSYDSMREGENRQRIICSVGQTLIKMIEKVPGGILLFFPSKSLMEECYQNWRTLFRKHHVLLETNFNETFIKKFKEKIGQKTWDQGKAVVIMGWCHGRLSEGLDFKDDAARLVCVIGIPNLPIYAPDVKIKREYLDSLEKNRGKSWYFSQAPKAINQAIGRLIRHQNDFGCIVLIDYRYAQYQNTKFISGWLQDRIKVTVDADDCINKVSQFFKRMLAKGLQPQPQRDSIEIGYESNEPDKF